ncbi:hypothetical protein PG997_008900 [Apiospora hydei]|uniref:Ankyrin n=1 Tax=Apiospora hydei TaxID=1337664 RepID=A0ABR1WDJ2_9PEZI
MDGFPTLPIEVARMILIETVKARGLRRAARLRFVSRCWKREVTDAIIDSGVLDGHWELTLSPFWPEYLMRHLMRTHRPLSRALRLLRLAAECVVAFRRSGNTMDSSSDDHSAVRQYLWEICQTHQRKRSWFTHQSLFLFLVSEPITPIHDTDEDFKLVLLAAASATNDVALVEQLLPTISEDCTRLFFSNTPPRCSPIVGHIGHPLEVAAFRGHVEVVRLLLGAVREPSLLKKARDAVLVHAAEGNQMETLELGLLPRYGSYDQALVIALKFTSSPDIFERVFSLCKDHSAEDLSADEPLGMAMRAPTVDLDDCLRWAAMRGHLIMTQRLSVGGLVSMAAEYGHTEVVAFLLERGLEYDPASLSWAAGYGNADCVRFLLERGAADRTDSMDQALVKAVKKENEPVVRLLLEWDNPPDKEAWQGALDAAEEQGLSSMISVLNGYKYLRRWVRTD